MIVPDVVMKSTPRVHEAPPTAREFDVAKLTLTVRPVAAKRFNGINICVVPALPSMTVALEINKEGRIVRSRTVTLRVLGKPKESKFEVLRNETVKVSFGSVGASSVIAI